MFNFHLHTHEKYSVGRSMSHVSPSDALATGAEPTRAMTAPSALIARLPFLLSRPRTCDMVRWSDCWLPCVPPIGLSPPTGEGYLCTGYHVRLVGRGMDSRSSRYSSIGPYSEPATRFRTHSVCLPRRGLQALHHFTTVQQQQSTVVDPSRRSLRLRIRQARFLAVVGKG